jgi:hypothetical protein
MSEEISVNVEEATVCRFLPTPPIGMSHKCGGAAVPGHKNIQHTVRYTDMAPDRFKDFSRD